MDYTEFKNPYFKQAVDAIDNGDITGLKNILEEYPDLINEQVHFIGAGYFERPYLIYFVADNPIRHEKIPDNVLGILEVLIENVNKRGDNQQEQLDYTLGLVTSGRIPKESGKQLAMMDLLLDAGAAPGDGGAAVAHGNLEAAKHLVERGGRYTLTTAVCFDDSDGVKKRAAGATKGELLTALSAAAFYAKPEMISLLVQQGAPPNGYPENGFHTHATPLHQAVHSGCLECVKLLIDGGADLNATDKAYHGTPLGWSAYMQTETTDKDELYRFSEVENYLKSLQ